MEIKDPGFHSESHGSLKLHQAEVAKLRGKYSQPSPGPLLVPKNRYQELRYEITRLSEQAKMDMSLATGLVVMLSVNNKVPMLYRQILTEVKPAWHELDEDGLYTEMQFGLRNRVAAGVNLDWNAKEDDFLGIAQYCYQTNTARFKYAKPDPTLTLIYLASTGDLPDFIKIVAHEIRHSMHKPPKGVKTVTYWKHAPNPEMMEAYASRTANQQPHIRERKETVDHIMYAKDRGKLVYPGMSRRKLESAVIWVDEMNAMGRTASQLGDDVRWMGDRWSKEKGVFENAEKRKRRVMFDLCLDNHGLDTLVLLDRMERIIDQQRVRILVSNKIFMASDSKAVYSPVQTRALVAESLGNHLGSL